MKVLKVMALVLATCLLFTACAKAQTGVIRKPAVSRPQSSNNEESTQSVLSQNASTQSIASSNSQSNSLLTSSTDSTLSSTLPSSSNVTGSNVYSSSQVLSGTVSGNSSVTTSSGSTTDINAVPDYLKDHPVMEGTRDKYYWPFSKDSIWNMPIGSNAQLEPAGFEIEKNVAVDPEYFVQVDINDPIVDVYSPSSWETRMPGKEKTGELKVPNDFILADGTGHNNCATFIMPNGYSFYQLEPTCRVAEYPDRIVGHLYSDEPMSLYEQGIEGTHYGSGLSAIGGSVRKGELTSDEPIRHALKINMWAHKYLYYQKGGVEGYTWPATNCDRYANTEGNKNKYEGTNPLIVQGSLLVLPKDVTVESLGIKTEVAKKIFFALQNYGAYISDDSAWSCYSLCAENGVSEEVEAKYGFSLTQTEYEENRGDYYDDFNKMMTSLCVVTNNTPDSIGGGGTPCQPLAPDFAE